jgi:hypothetical protein
VSFFVVDIESDGPIPGDYSMIEFGAVLVERGLNRTFHRKLAPISERWVPAALAVSGRSREQVVAEGADPQTAMAEFEAWVKEVATGRPVFVSDNNGFDWMFVCWYFHHFLGQNPFGFSSRRIGDLYCGMERNAYAQWKHLRRTRHTHNPVDDARGNAEALLHMRDVMGLNIDLV